MDAVEPGDQVLYIDSDEITWGPWPVLSVSNTELVVQVENMIQLLVRRSCVQKIE